MRSKPIFHPPKPPKSPKAPKEFVMADIGRHIAIERATKTASK